MQTRFGSEVGARIAQVPGAMRVAAPPELQIWLVRGFLDDATCTGLIARIDNGRQPSRVLADAGDPDYRTSESCNLDPADPLVAAVEAKLTALTGVDPALGETIQGQRYATGQQFKPHHDFFLTDQPYWPTQQAAGGQRTWTAMVYLNDVAGGGRTDFPAAGVRIAARAGNLLAWNNLDAVGAPNPLTIHQGMPVEDGVKYIITKWYRERPWRREDA